MDALTLTLVLILLIAVVLFPLWLVVDTIFLFRKALKIYIKKNSFFS